MRVFEQILTSSLMCIQKGLLTAILLIGSVGAFLAMVAFLKFGYALFAVGTSEFGEVAGSTLAILSLVRFVATVKVPIALLFLGNAEAVAAFMILFLTGAIIWNKAKI